MKNLEELYDKFERKIFEAYAYQLQLRSNFVYLNAVEILLSYAIFLWIR